MGGGEPLSCFIICPFLQAWVKSKLPNAQQEPTGLHVRQWEHSAFPSCLPSFSSLLPSLSLILSFLSFYLSLYQPFLPCVFLNLFCSCLSSSPHPVFVDLIPYPLPLPFLVTFLTPSFSSLLSSQAYIFIYLVLIILSSCQFISFSRPNLPVYLSPSTSL